MSGPFADDVRGPWPIHQRPGDRPSRPMLGRAMREALADDRPTFDAGRLALEVRRILADDGIPTPDGSHEDPVVLDAVRDVLASYGVRPVGR